MPELVLASTSPYRRELLARLGLTFRTCAPRCDEEALKRGLGAGLEPVALAALLAREKALSVARDEPAAHVIGSDQLGDLDGEVLGKPGSREACEAQLARLAGKSHRLITAVYLACPGGAGRTHVDVTTLTMRPLGPAEIRRYVAQDLPFDCAGGYKFERAGVALFERVICADFSAITGLPLIALAGLLRIEGFPVP